MASASLMCQLPDGAIDSDALASGSSRSRHIPYSQNIHRRRFSEKQQRFYCRECRL